MVKITFVYKPVISIGYLGSMEPTYFLREVNGSFSGFHCKKCMLDQNFEQRT